MRKVAAAESASALPGTTAPRGAYNQLKSPTKQGRGQRGRKSGIQGSGVVVVVAYKIGRGTANDIVVEDSSVSRCHAELRVADDKCVLVDLGSTNGTCVREDGRWIEIEKASVARDERILLGEVVTTVTALIDSRRHEPPSLAVRSLPANERTTPGRNGRREEAPRTPAGAPPVFGEANDHARLIGRPRRDGRGPERRRAAPPRREPTPPSRGPIVYSGIAARVNGTPDAGPARTEPQLRSDRPASAPVPPQPRAAATSSQPAPSLRSTPYLQVPPFAPGLRPAGLADPPPAPVRVPVHRQAKRLALAAMGGLLALTIVVAGMRYGDRLVGVFGLTPDSRAAVIASTPARTAARLRRTGATTPGDRGWQRFIGGPGNDLFSAAARYRNGGVVLVGTTTAGLPASADLWAVRLSPDGKILWRRAFGGSGADRGLAVAAARDGGALVAGAADDRSAAWMLRLDAGGRKLWERKIKVGTRSFATAVVATPDGGFAALVVGRAAATAPARTWLVRLDDQGKELWRRPLRKGSVFGTDLVSIRDTGFAVAGVRTTDDSGPTLWVARLNNDGITRWERTLPQAGRDGRAFLRIARRDDIIIATTQRSGDKAATDGTLRLVRLDRDGDTLWDRTVKARTGLQITGMFLVKRGIIVSGVERSDTPWLARVDVAGAVVWERRFSALKAGRADAIAERGRGGILLAGRIDRGETRKQDGLLLLLDRAGRPQD